MKIKNLVLGSILGLSLVACSTIENGERGLKVTFGDISSDILTEGLYFYNPFTTEMIRFDVKENVFKFTAVNLTQDIQEVTTQLVITFSPDKSKINRLYQEYGLNYEEKIILPIAISALKDIIGKTTAVDFVTKQGEIESKIFEKLREEYSKRFITLSKISILNIDFKAEFKNSIESKVIANQMAEKAKNDTIRIKEEAEQRLIQARAEAEAMKIKSDALSKNKSLVEYEAVLKWNGNLPQYMLGNSIPFINLKKQGE